MSERSDIGIDTEQSKQDASNKQSPISHRLHYLRTFFTAMALTTFSCGHPTDESAQVTSSDVTTISTTIAPVELDALEHGTSIIGVLMNVRIEMPNGHTQVFPVCIDRIEGKDDFKFVVAGKSYQNTNYIGPIKVTEEIDEMTTVEQGILVESKTYGHAVIPPLLFRQAVKHLAELSADKTSVPGHVEFIPKNGTCLQSVTQTYSSVAGQLKQLGDFFHTSAESATPVSTNKPNQFGATFERIPPAVDKLAHK